MEEVPGSLAEHLTRRSGVLITADDVVRTFYFYVFDNKHVLAITANPKGEKWLLVDGTWHHSERQKF